MDDDGSVAGLSSKIVICLFTDCYQVSADRPKQYTSYNVGCYTMIFLMLRMCLTAGDEFPPQILNVESAQLRGSQLEGNVGTVAPRCDHR